MGGGGGGLPTTPQPLNTSTQDTQHSCKNTYTAARRLPHPSYKQQHTFMYLMFSGPKMASLVPFQGQKSLNFQGPPLPMPLVMMLHSSIPLSISAIKTTGTLVVLCTRVLLCAVVCCCVLLLCVVVCCCVLLCVVVCCCVLLCVRGVGRSPCSCVV